MQCFYHLQNAAIGVCKACQKGLCTECVTDLDHGIACKNKHEKQVAMIDSIWGRSENMMSASSRAKNAAPLFILFLGLAFAGFGYFQGSGIKDMGFVMGCGFVVFSVITFVYNRQAFASRKNGQSS